MRCTGPWSIERIHAHLAETVVPLRLACVEASGHPRVLSLWFEWREGALWCATSPRSRLARWLAAEPRCGFEVVPDVPPYRGVRGRASATLDAGRGGEVLERLIDRYIGSRDTRLARWLLARSAGEIAIRIEPASFASLDFSARMR
jgi:hypothetical protein